MFTNKRFAIQLTLCLSCLFSLEYRYVYAQDSATPDGLFQMARKAAFEESDYTKAKVYCNMALDLSPGYTDVTVFLGRVYSWNKQYDSARTIFQKALDQHADYTDASIAFADVEYWTGNNNEALRIINAGLAFHPRSGELLLRKAKVLTAMRAYGQAAVIVDSLLKQNPDNAPARALAGVIKDNTAPNKIGLGYDYVYFDKQYPDPWQLVSLEYLRQTKAAAIIGRINYANRFGANGVQYELESYPHLSRTFYAYMNLGYSDNTGVFPHWRAGLSLYAIPAKSFEVEGGWRYLYFSRPTNILTAYMGKYYKNYLFGFRTFITPGGSSLGQSYSIFARLYFGGMDDFIALTAGTGLSPDDRPLAQQLNSQYNLKTYRGAIEFRRTIKTRNIISLNASLVNQEYLPKTAGNQIQAGIKYWRRF